MRIESLGTLHFWIVTLRLGFLDLSRTNAKNPVYYSNVFSSLLQEYDYIYYHKLYNWSMDSPQIHTPVRRNPPKAEQQPKAEKHRRASSVFPPSSCLHPDDPGTKGHETELRHFEALETKGDTHDGQAKGKASQNIHRCQLQSAQENPQQIDEERTRPHPVIAQIFPEGEQLQRSHFKTLNPHGNADDRHGP